jgi:6-phosphogluconolactonase
MDLSSGALRILDIFRGIPNPSYLAIAPSGRFLYCVNELKEGRLSAFAIGASLELRFINSVSSRGSDPCYAIINDAETHVFAANYGSGSVSLFPLERNGALAASSCVVRRQGRGTHPVRQEGPHAHSIFLDPANKTAFAADLGLDTVFAYTPDYAAGTLIPEKDAAISLAPGSGPRHCVFSPAGDTLYIVNELGLSLAVCKYDRERRRFSPAQILPLLAAETGDDTAADIGLHPNGKWLYVSVRGADLIVLCEIDAVGLARVRSRCPSGGKTPRNFLIDPSGRYLLAGNQDSGGMVVFSIDPRDGGLTEVSRLPIPNPVCIKAYPQK